MPILKKEKTNWILIAVVVIVVILASVGIWKSASLYEHLMQSL